MNDFPESPAMLDDLSTILSEVSQPLQPLSTDTPPRLRRLEDVRAVVFDVYGTLFISGCGEIGVLETDQKAAFLHALTAIGLDGDLTAAAARGTGLLTATIHAYHAATRAQGIATPEVDIRQVWTEIFTILANDKLINGRPGHDDILRFAFRYECEVNPVYPMPGLAECLTALRDAGFLLGIVSNAQFFTPVLFHAFLGGLPRELGFDPDLTAWSYRTLAAKPGTELYDRMLTNARDMHGLVPSQILYVGNDMLNDIWPAADCGCRTALFAGDRRSLRWRENDERVGATEPDVIITELPQILEVLPR